jgi:outer membrane receptor protein involved in Fe transport
VEFAFVCTLGVTLLGFFSPPIEGLAIDARTRLPITGAEVTIVGQRGSERTGAAGRFRWDPAGVPPFVVIVVLQDGRVARPIQVARVDPAEGPVLIVEAAVSEALTVTGASPTIDVPAGASTTWLSGEQIGSEHPATLSQTLGHVAGVSTIAEGQGAVPTVRGLARGRTLILVDEGRVSTERRAGPNASFLDPAGIRSVEIARGPGSVAYGSDAFGGVIAVQMRRPDHRTPFSVQFSSTIGGGLPEKSATLEVSSGYGKGGILASFHGRTFDDYRAPDGVVPNSAWRDAGGRVAWEHATGASRWSARWQRDRGRAIGRPRSDSSTIRASNPFENSDRFSASYARPAFAGLRDVRISGSSGWVSDRTQQERLPAARAPRNIDQSDQSFRDLQLRMVGERTIHAVRLQAGADLLGRYGLQAIDTTIAYNTLDAIASTQTSLSIESAHRTETGLFVQADAPIARRMRLSGGLRTQAVRNTNVGGFFGSRSVANAALAGLGALTVVPFDSMTLTAQVARGFRDPTLSDRFYRGPVGRGFVEGNPNLKPETSVQFDLVARYATGRLRLAGAVYDYRITDLIERYVVGSTSFFFRNRGEARLRGGEAEAQIDLARGFAVEGIAQTSSGHDATDGTPIDDIAPGAVSATLRYAAPRQLSMYLRIAAVGAHSDAGPGEVATPAYRMMDAGTSWRVRRHLEIRGVGRNLLNARYYSSAGPRWVYGPGRQGSVTMVVRY